MKILRIVLLLGGITAFNMRASDEPFKAPATKDVVDYYSPEHLQLIHKSIEQMVVEKLPVGAQRAASVLWQRIERVVTTDQKNAFVEKLPNLIKDYKESLADALLYVPDQNGIYVERTLLEHVHAARAYAEKIDDDNAIFFYNGIALELDRQKAHAPNKPARPEVDGKKIAAQRLKLQQKADNPDSQANTGAWKAVLKGGLVIAGLALVGVACYFGIPYLKNRRAAPAKAGS